MEILYMLVPLALLFAGGALVVFFKAISAGQFDDMVTPAQRILINDELKGEEETPHDT